MDYILYIVLGGFLFLVGAHVWALNKIIRDTTRDSSAPRAPGTPLIKGQKKPRIVAPNELAAEERRRDEKGWPT